jgi:hypothetical protein
MSRVFIVQKHLVQDRTTGLLKEKLDMTPAMEFGRLAYLLEADPSPGRTAEYIERMAKMLDDFCDDDYLLLTGSPVLIGVAFALAADANGGRVRTLQYNRKFNRYDEIDCKVWEEDS